MEKLNNAIKELKKSKIGKIIENRINDFKKIGEKSSLEIFKELCFCILTANFDAEKSIRIQTIMGNKFLELNEIQLARKLRKLGHRYPKSRARYIILARKYKNIRDIISRFDDTNKLREWLVDNVKGIGYKEASHFLRNIGYTNLAILDFHIIKLLVKYDLIEQPKTLTRKKYLKIEELLRKIARELNLNLAELDLYLWYMEAKKILK